MRQVISGLAAAVAVVTVSAIPALACGGGLFGSCSPCGQTYVEPCAQPQVYVAPEPVHTGCNTGCGGGWGYDRLADPVQQYHAAPARHQYYYVNEGPAYTGPGSFAPYPTYQEGADYGFRTHPHYHAWHHSYHYGYMPHHYYGEHVLRRYY
jgi:hypothetical protein